MIIEECHSEQPMGAKSLDHDKRVLLVVLEILRFAQNDIP
jgi:hypothetical protein